MNPEVHHIYSHRYDLRFQKGLMQATHTHRLMRSEKGYSTYCCSLGMMRAMRLWWAQSLKVSSWLQTSEASLSFSRELTIPCSRPMTMLYGQQPLTHFAVSETGSIDSCCCHCLFSCNISKQSLRWALPTVSEVTILVSSIVFPKLKQISAIS